MKKRIVFSALMLLSGLLFLSPLNAGAGSPRLVDLGNGICKDLETGLMWQVRKSHKFYTEEEAQKYVKSLRLGGYSDWRLPTKKERWDLLHVFLLNKQGNCTLKYLGLPYWTTNTDKGTRPIRLEIACYCRDDQVISYARYGFVRAVRRDTPEKK